MPSPGVQQALDRAQPVEVVIAGTTGVIYRPNLVGALVVKAAAYSINDQYKSRHSIDFAVLASLVGRADRLAELLTKRDLSYLNPMLDSLARSRELWTSIEGAEEGIARVAAAIESAQR